MDCSPSDDLYVLLLVQVSREEHRGVLVQGWELVLLQSACESLYGWIVA